MILFVVLCECMHILFCYWIILLLLFSVPSPNMRSYVHQAGYVGEDVESILYKLLAVCTLTLYLLHIFFLLSRYQLLRSNFSLGADHGLRECPFITHLPIIVKIIAFDPADLL